MSQQVDAATVTSQEAEGASDMSRDVSVRGTGGAIFAGTLLILGGSLWMLEGLAGIVRGTS
jgi:hypothetical protein